MKDVNADIQKLNALKNEFQLIVRHLDHLEYQGLLSAYYKRTLIEMSEKVVDNLAANYENVKEGVKSVMGGKVLEYEAKTILRQGERQGEQKGIRQGRLDALVETIKNLMETMGWTAEQAMDNMKISTDDRIIISSRL
ncbi:MAG: hypothetical protein LUG61_04115 [Lachnospiraceae bacterium]|nr:hypothetical protein [Lachnospiraceae bacterium]